MSRDHDTIITHTHGLGVRLTHWINVVALTGMWWSGLLIDWADRPYAIRVSGVPVTVPYPAALYDMAAAPGRLAEGIAWHLSLAWLFLANAILYALLLAVRSGWRRILPLRRSWSEAVREVRSLRQRPSGPGNVYHGAQRLADTGVLTAGAGALLTGIALWKPVQVSWLVTVLGGYQGARIAHLAASVVLLLFTVVHVVQVIRSGWNRALGIVTGFETDPVGEGVGRD